MASFTQQAQLAEAMLSGSPAWARLCELHPEADSDILEPVFTSAAEMAEEIVAPANAIADQQGCSVVDGRVHVPEAYKPVWQAYSEAGWLGADLPAEQGGQGLPLALQTGAQILFDRASMAFCMLPGSTRSAAFVLAKYADPETRAEWLSDLVEGKRSATICISEADAGSDLARIRTRAEQAADGSWQITGRKNWISYGDHDLTQNIAHMVLARTDAAETGTRGLSLFLVPNRIGEPDHANVSLERIEEKLGLHGSPTCVLNFDQSQATLIGEVGRGLPQLFVMIERMRLLTATQGCGIAHAALDIAENYAEERKQGGDPKSEPLPIIAHPDVQRQIAEMSSRTLALQAFVLELATLMDVTVHEEDTQTQAEHAALVAWLQPVAKNFGGYTGFDCADRAIQVLGGAGYTKEWPLEQLLRDARILTIFEGTTGMQALDLLHRRLWREEGQGLKAFATRMRTELDTTRQHDAASAETAQTVLEALEKLAADFNQRRSEPREAEYGANALLEAAWHAVSAWMGLRLLNLGEQDQKWSARFIPAGKLSIRNAAINIRAAAAKAALPSGLYTPVNG
jgi:alkylation response protein AidB-like acyl-CoA dehydrogenase